MAIMKNTLPALLAIGLTSVLCLSAFALPKRADSGSTGAALRISQDDEMEARMLALETEIKELKMSNKKQEALLTQAIKYLENQAKSGAKLAQVLDRSEGLGFTKGINFESREVMLSGLRAHTKALQEDVPRNPKSDAKADTKPVARRR